MIEILDVKDISQKYIVYYYPISLGVTHLNKKCFESINEIVDFIKSNNYHKIDAIYIKGQRVDFDTKLKVILDGVEYE